MMKTDGQPVEILLVEDDPTDVLLAREALREADMHCNLNVVPDGIEALSYLRGQGKYETVLLPDLILLDLKMPKKGGLEVLSEIKEDEELRHIPVIVLTTSDAPSDIAQAYQLQIGRASCRERV